MSAGRPPLPRVVFGLAVALAGFEAAAVAFFTRHGGRVKDFGWTLERRAGDVSVATVDPAGPAAGALAPGDRLRAVNGDPRLERVLGLHFFLVRPGTYYTLELTRDGRPREVTLPVGVRVEPREWRRGLPRLLASLVVAVAVVAVGLRRPHDPSARRFCWAGAALVLALLSAGIPSLDLLAPVEYAVAIVMTAASPVHLALAFDVASRLPGVGASVWARAARAGLYVVGVPLSLATLVQRFTYLRDPATVIGFASDHPLLWDARTRVVQWFAPAAAAALAVALLAAWRAGAAEGRHAGRLPAAVLVLSAPALAAGALGLLASRTGSDGLGAAASLLGDLAPLGLAAAGIVWARAVLRRAG